MSLGRTQVDAVVRLGQDEAERAIAGFRAIILGAMCLVVVSLFASGHSENLGFTVLLPASALLALGLLLLVRRFGAPPWLRRLSTFSDLLIPAAIFYFGIRGEPEDQPLPHSIVGSFAGALVTIILVVSLRSDRWLGLAAGAGGAASYVVVMTTTTGYDVFYVPTAVLILFGGGVAFFAATRLRVTLDRFARLQLLGQFLPAPAVERVLRGELDETLAVGGQEVTLTVLAADLRGFTAFSEGLSPTEVVAQLNAYHAVMLEAVRAHGGVLDKFIGDGMLAHFGLRPGSGAGALAAAGDCGANAAVAAAQAMLRGLDALNADRAAKDQPPFRMGIGVHTGRVIAGNIGAPGHRMEFTLIGDAVNVAARLEAATKELGAPVAVSADTVALLEEPSAFAPAGPLALRGRLQPLPVFTTAQLQNADRLPSAPR